MKKHFLWIATLLLAISLVFCFIGCKDPVAPETSNEKSENKTEVFTGSISGIVKFSNATNSEGIIVSLEKITGLNSERVLNQVKINTSHKTRSTIGNSTTNEMGEYKFSNLENGSYTVYAYSNSSTEKAISVNVVVENGKSVRAPALKLTATGSLTGQIVITDANDELGSAGFIVSVLGTSFMGMTDVDGYFTLTGIPATTENNEYSLVIKNGDFTYLIKNIKVSSNKTTDIGKKEFTSQEVNSSVSVENGKDGTSIIWKGSFALPPENPEYLWAYFNTTDGCSYIYNGSEWTLMVQAGADGEKGQDGKDGQNGINGTCLIWQGSYESCEALESAKGEPNYLWAYFNVTDGCSYIYDGTSWVLLVQAGADGTDGVDGEKGEAGENGVSIIWLGSFASESEIENPIVMNAYYNSMDGCSYLYNGTQWVLLARGSSDVSIVWKGSFENSDVAELQEPSLYWAYYNTTDGCSYLYNGSEWTLLFSDVLNNTPDSVSNLTINYSSPNKKITLNWKNPSDEKFDHVVISCTKDGILILEDAVPEFETFVLENVEADSSMYVFKVCAVDIAGNKSNGLVSTIIATEGPSVYSLELDRVHLSGSDTNRNVVATIYGNNFDKIEQEIDPTIKIYVYLGNSVIANGVAEIDVENNKATATVVIPSNANATVEGINYTVKVRLCGYVLNNPTKNINVSTAADLTNITLSNSQILVYDVNPATKTIATLTGTNFDTAHEIKIRLFDRKGVQYGQDINVDTRSLNKATTSFDVEIPVPSDDEHYTVKVFFDEIQSLTTTELWVYDIPKFEEIPLDVIKYENAGKTIEVLVKGRNFMSDGVLPEMFTFSCAEDSSVVETSILRIEDDCNAYLSIKVPNVNDKTKDFYYTITINYASSTITKVLEVTYIDIGDFITKDGYILHKYKSLTTAEKESVIAIVCSCGSTKVKGLGLKEDGYFSWATKDTEGCTSYFSEIESEFTVPTYIGTFEGDLYGSDNWDYICSKDPIGTLDAAKYYPVFNFAINYGVTAGLEGTDYEEGWYVPSIYELFHMYYYNIDTLNTSLNKVYGSNTFGTRSYWSSSQANYFSYACLLSYDRTSKKYSVVNEDKYDANYVRVVHDFNVQ